MGNIIWNMKEWSGYLAIDSALNKHLNKNILISHCFYDIQSQLNLKWLKALPRATCYGGSLNMNTPMLFALGFVFMFTIGGLIIHLVLPKASNGY